MSPIELKELATYTIKPYLSQVAGVSEIRIIGGKSKEYWVQLDLQKMSTLSLTPDMINVALGQTNFLKSNGYLSDYRYLYLTVTDASVKTIDQLKNLVISNNGKRIIRLQDIADIQVKEAVEYIKVNANGKESILIAVIKQPNANLIDLSNKMAKQVEQLRQILPKDVIINPFYVQADFVNTSVKSVTDSVWIGLGLSIIVVVIFLRSLKASITILITIPVTLMLTLIVLNAWGYTFNIMTLGAIAAAIGLIIDDAIVVLEQIHRTHEENPDESTSTLLQHAIGYLFPAMVGSSLSTIVIFIPFLLMSGVAGAYFKVMTDTMIITLVCSFFVTWIGLPVIYLLLTRNSNIKQEKVKEHHVKKLPWINFFVSRVYISIGFMVVLIISIVLILPHLQTGFLPEMDEGSIVVDYNSPPGTSLEETDRMLRGIEKILVKIPEVQTYSRRTGTQMGFFITEPNRGDYLVELKEKRKRTTDEVINELRQKIEASEPALTVDFGQVITDMLGDLMSSVQPVEIKIFGDDRQKLNTLSKQVAQVVGKVQGTADVFDGIVIAGPSIDIRPNSSKLAQYGLTPADLQTQVETSLQGVVVGNLLEKEMLSNIRMVLPGSMNRSLAEIKQTKIFLPDGQLIPINSLADVNILPGDAEIERENLQSMGVVTARLNNRDLGSVMNDIKNSINKQINMPSGYHVEYGGAYADQQQSFKELLMILITSSFLVFAVILFLFRDVKIALIILLVAVLGISGSYLALFITNTPLNVGSYTGLIMIVGIIGENSIFTFLQFKENLNKKSVKEAVIYAIRIRLRPNLMTALGAIVALMPLALGIGAGAQLHQPLAIAVIGGFLVAMPLLLIVLPSMLILIYKGVMEFDTL
ncbi:MAG TPA: acriflavine resistance protein B [Sphingobacteriaceae bacterium]|nr:acriflavine resistance protein B [Sphingobacteriaceae bacterium]